LKFIINYKVYENKEKKDIKRIKENITEFEFKKLMSFVRGNKHLRFNTKLNFLRTFTILFFTIPYLFPNLKINYISIPSIIFLQRILKLNSNSEYTHNRTKTPLEAQNTSYLYKSHNLFFNAIQEVLDIFDRF
jgi:hypothetical protein